MNMKLPFKDALCEASDRPGADAPLRARTAMLPPRERDVVEAALFRDQSVRRIAQLRGLTPRAVRYRLNRGMRRMRSERFRQTMRARAFLSPDDARLAALRFCQAVPIARLAGREGVSLHAMRRRLDRIAAQISLLSDGVAGRRRAS